MIFSLKTLFFVILLIAYISTSDLAFAQSYSYSNTTQSKLPIVPRSPVLSDSQQQAIINAALSVPGLRAWSNQWQYIGMDFIGSTSGWQYAIVNLSLPVNASAPFHCDNNKPWFARVEVDMATKQVISAGYPTLENHSCDVNIYGGPPGYVEPSNNTIIKNTTAYNLYITNNGPNSTVPEFPFVVPILVISLMSLLIFYRIKLKI